MDDIQGIVETPSLVAATRCSAGCKKRGSLMSQNPALSEGMRPA